MISIIIVDFDNTVNLEKMNCIINNNDFEIIIVGNKKICCDTIRNCRNIYIEEINSSKARNLGLKYAVGQYIMFVNLNDDLNEINDKDFIGIDSDLYIIPMTYVIDEKNMSVKPVMQCEYLKDNMIYNLLHNNELIIVENKIYKKDILLKNEIMFDEKAVVGNCHNILFNLNVIKYASKITLNNESKYIHYLSKSKFDTYIYSTKRLVYEKKIYRMSCEVIEKNNEIDSIIAQNYIKRIMLYARSIISPRCIATMDEKFISLQDIATDYEIIAISKQQKLYRLLNEIIISISAQILMSLTSEEAINIMMDESLFIAKLGYIKNNLNHPVNELKDICQSVLDNKLNTYNFGDYMLELFYQI